MRPGIEPRSPRPLANTLLIRPIIIIIITIIIIIIPGDWGSILGWVIPKTQIMVLDATLLNTQHYKIGIKSKVEQSREWSSALLYISV